MTARFALPALCAALVGMPAHAANWITFGGSANRLGVQTETALTPATVSGLALRWQLLLSDTSTAQPLYVEGAVAGHNEVFQVTRSGQVAAVNAATGALDWATQLPVTQASGCIPASWGPGGTPTIDPVAGVLYEVDATGALHALNLGSGTEAPGYPVQVVAPTDVALGSFNHSSPTQIGSTLYITISAIGACEAAKSLFRGAVIEFNAASMNVVGTWYPVQATIGGGGIWGPGGVALDPKSGDLLVATGNALTRPSYGRGAESVVELDQNLDLLAEQTPGKPVLTKGGDFDFGSTPVPIEVGKCKPLLAVLNKTGNLYVYEQKKVKAGPLQVLDVSAGGGGPNSLFGMAAYDPATSELFLNNPLASANGSYTNGAIAFQAGCGGLSVAWQSTFGNNQVNGLNRSTQPVVAGGLVWVSTGANDSVIALNEATGAPVWSTASANVTAPTTGPVAIADGQLFFQSGLKLMGYALTQ
jgi:outer membrane protein assembly factor BamB